MHAASLPGSSAAASSAAVTEGKHPARTGENEGKTLKNEAGNTLYKPLSDIMYNTDSSIIHNTENFKMKYLFLLNPIKK